MHSFNANQQTILSSAAKTVYWLFENGSNYWSTKAVAATVYNSQAYTFKVLPESFSGIELSRPNSDNDTIAASTVNFEVSNAGNVLSAGDFEDTTLTVKLVISNGTLTALFNTWTFNVKQCEPLDQKLKFSCEDILQKYLEGDWPDRVLVSTINPTQYEINDSLCVPIICGTAYIPVRSQFFTDDRYYVIAMDGEDTVTADKFRSPSDSVYGISTFEPGDYSFTYADKTKGGGAPIFRTLKVHSGAESNKLFPGGNGMLDALANLTDSSSVTNVGDVIEFALESFGVPSATLDTGVGSTFAAVNTACAAYGGTGIEFNTGFYTKKPKRDILALLLNAANLTIRVEDKIKLYTISQNNSDFVATFDDSIILKNGNASASTSFSYNIVTTEEFDAGNLNFQKPGAPMDKFIQAVVPVGATENHISTETLELPIIYDTSSESKNSKYCQTAARLYFQRKYLQKANISFNSMPANLSSPTASPIGVQPDDIIKINDTRYGGTFYALVDKLTIGHGLSIDFDCTVFTAELENWGDYSPDEIIVDTDTSTGSWYPVIAGETHETSEGDTPNSLPGAINIGDYVNTKYIIIDPSVPEIRLIDSTDILALGRIGVDIYGIKITDGSGNALFQIDNTPQAIIGGWEIGVDELSYEDSASWFHLKPDEGIWLGASAFVDAPFSVDIAGNLIATSVYLEGEITATTGAIGGFLITATQIYAPPTALVLDSEYMYLAINDITFGNLGIQAQYNAGAPRFYVGDGDSKYLRYEDGELIVSGVNILEALLNCGGFEEDMDENLIIHYKFDETAGGMAADAQENYDGTLFYEGYPGPGFDNHWVPGKKNNCLQFDNSLVVITGYNFENITQGNHSFVFWVKKDSDESYMYGAISGVYDWLGPIYSWWRIGTGNYGAVYPWSDYSLTDIYFFFHHAGNSFYLVGRGAITAGSWHHVVISLNFNSLGRIYVDGTLRHSQDITHVDPSSFRCSRIPAIGGNYYGGFYQHGFRGYIDEFRVYSMAFSLEQAIELYDNEE